jgi:hypothetical protein
MELFVSQCAVCQKAKYEHCQPPGLLAPLPVPSMAWAFIFIYFIEGLPKSGTKDAILVVVDKLIKYSHFIALSHLYTSHISIHG